MSTPNDDSLVQSLLCSSTYSSGACCREVGFAMLGKPCGSCRSSSSRCSTSCVPLQLPPRQQCHSSISVIDAKSDAKLSLWLDPTPWAASPHNRCALDRRRNNNLNRRRGARASKASHRAAPTTSLPCGSRRSQKCGKRNGTMSEGGLVGNLKDCDQRHRKTHLRSSAYTPQSTTRELPDLLLRSF
jgi:hypothetical protein